jgi:hypothetical protein
MMRDIAGIGLPGNIDGDRRGSDETCPAIDRVKS